ncbi:Helicase conserved C-terminal domain containing protein, putative [Angomonas deanei]|uniref:Helicase conserved C-terminal domain containing protein, putative n=1 Tax=Angomonas deanei TaxID=59799 RepID=A0A7G2C2P8_9TRYP|nr:Helicase conserved C-terminal domain containing protein, putative [Angomonas deanei]
MGRVLAQLEIKPRNAKVFALSPQSGVVAKVNETYLRCPEKSKDLYLYYFLRTFKDERAVIFVNAISMLRRLVKIIEILGISVVGLHASMQQRQRLKFMDKFKAGQIRVLVATDVASRGLDIEGLKYVLHFQVPRTTDAYIHRCGRTARCGGTGLSLLLVNPQEHVSFKKLMESLGRKESEMEVFSLQPTVVHQLHPHLRIALQIDKLRREIDKSRAKNHWVTRMSKSAELDVDDMVDKEADAENREKEKAIRLLQKELQLLIQKFSGSYGGKGAFRTGAQALGAKLAEEKQRERADRQAIQLTGIPLADGKQKKDYTRKELTVYDVINGKSESASTKKKTKKGGSVGEKKKRIKFE